MCRRCSDCVGMSHHWVENTSFGDDEERIENNSTTHLCKHCDAMGDECEECSGSGWGEGDFNGEYTTFPCSECGGSGVVLIAGGKEINADTILPTADVQAAEKGTK